MEAMMGIPEDQLKTWAKQGSVQGSSETYNLVKETLEEDVAPYHGKDVSVFLQGSYGNDTNIIGESDVDIVIRLKDCWQSDLSELNEEQETAYKEAYSNATYGHVEFRKDVLTVLRNEYGKGVEDGNKAIYVPPSDARRATDVVAAIQFRRYFKFNGLQDQSYAEGICFYDKAGTRIANYPKQHSENVTKRHQDSNEWLKPMVRIIKNARTKMVNDEALEAGIAPSYFLEGLLYNAPLECFGTNYNTSLQKVLQWMYDTEDDTKWVTANEQYYLLRDGYATCWPTGNYATFKNAIIKLWNDW
jgi:hypothetical protein